MSALFAVDDLEPARRTNPVIDVYGRGPTGARCRDCALLTLPGGTAGRYFKCALREQSRSERTDHRATWPACGRFEARP